MKARKTIPMTFFYDLMMEMEMEREIKVGDGQRGREMV